MKETFTEWLRKQPDYGIFNPPISSEKALDFLFDYLLIRMERKKVKREYKRMKRKNERRLKKERKYGTNKTDRNILRC